MRSITLAFGLLVLAAPVATAQSRPLRLDDLFRLAEVSDPQISPDGKWVAYTVQRMDAKEDESDGDIFMAPAAGGAAIRLTASAKSETHPRWSPDGRYLAFLSGREGKKTQVWLMNRTGGEAVKLTDFKADISDLAWSPDGRRLALVVSDPDPEDQDDEDAEGSAKKKKTKKPIVIRRLQFKRDGEGYLTDLRSHVYLFDVEAKTSFQLTSGAYDDEQPAWSPDGRLLAFVSDRTADPDASRDSDVFVVEPRPGASVRRLASGPGTDRSPSWSPDSRTLVYERGGDPADMWYATTHVAIIAADGSQAPRALTEALDRNVGRPRFSADGRSISFLLEDGGNQHLARVPAAGGAVERVVKGEREVGAYSVSPAGEVAVLVSEPAQPEEVFTVGAAGALVRVSRVNDEVLKTIRLGGVERFKARSADGTMIDGFLTRPPEAPEGKKLPTILRIHGGPVSQYSTAFNLEWQMLAAHGYAVVAANPRGSSGYGRAFSRAIWADWGNKDFEDVMAAVDHVIAMGVADADRLGVGGWSYGGILTDYVITKTSRFKAATSGASETNYLANYGTDHYQYEWERELGLPWQNVERWVKLSPWFQVEKITTPTLILCGADDVNVPLLNSEQLYQALRRLGKTTELVIYPDQNHGIVKPSYVKDRYERYVAWYDRFLMGKTPPAPVARTPEATSLLGVALFPVELPAERKAPLEQNLQKAMADFVKDPDSADNIIWLGRRLSYLSRFREAVELPAERKAPLEQNLQKAMADFVKDPDSADNIIWLGRRLSYLSRFREAVEVYTRGIARHPDDARLLRHRGHRYITLRQFDRAIADLEKAAQLIAGKPDVIEPDGAPNPSGVPTTTLGFNVWYHLGLAHYLKGDFEKALAAYRECLKTAGQSDDRLVSISDWLYMTLRRLGRKEEAARVLDAIRPDMKILENRSYFHRLLLYKGLKKPEELLGQGEALDMATQGYGVANWYLYNGDAARAKELFEKVVAGEQWAAFGFIASEAELARMGR